MSRDPDTYAGNLYKFDGKILQVMVEAQSDGTTLTALRVPSSGSYDNVVYVVYHRAAGESAFRFSSACESSRSIAV
jgi:hypothetical protein